MIGVYEIVNMVDGKNSTYIGSSININQRWSQHRYCLNRGTHKNPHLQSAWNKYGTEAFRFSVIQEVAEAGLRKHERQHILECMEVGNCYNLTTDTIAPMRGRTLSIETRQKISKAKKGVSLGPCSEETKRKISKANKGRKPKPASAETRKKISEALKGRKRSEEHQRKLTAARQGYVISQETKDKISKTMTGRKLSREHARNAGLALRGKKASESRKRKIGLANSKPYPALRNRETREIIPSGYNLRALCRRRDLSQSCMWMVINGKRAHHKNWALCQGVDAI